MYDALANIPKMCINKELLSQTEAETYMDNMCDTFVNCAKSYQIIPSKRNVPKSTGVLNSPKLVVAGQRPPEKQ